jgi:hypothetical protein
LKKRRIGACKAATNMPKPGDCRAINLQSLPDESQLIVYCEDEGMHALVARELPCKVACRAACSRAQRRGGCDAIACNDGAEMRVRRASCPGKRDAIIGPINACDGGIAIKNSMTCPNLPNAGTRRCAKAASPPIS